MHPLESYRQRKGLSLRTLAELAGTTAASLSRVIRYEQTPSLGLVQRLVDVCEGELVADQFFDPLHRDARSKAS